MRRNIGFFSFVVIVFMCLMVGGVSAQGDFTDEETEWIDIVAQAFEDTLNADSYSAEVEQHLLQEISSGGAEAVTELNQTIELEVEEGDEGVNFLAVVEQAITIESGAQTNEVEMTLELLQVDGEFFARASDLSPRALSASFPDDWVNVTEDGNRYPLLNAMNLGSPGLLYNSALILVIDEDTVLAIEEDDADEISGLEMRVFQIEYSAEAMLQSDSMASVIDALAGLLPQIDLNDLLDQLAEGSEMSLTVWIGEDDELVHRADTNIRIDVDVAMSGVELRLVQDSEATASYGEFGEDFDLEAPDL